MDLSHVDAITLFVEDKARSKEFYERVFGQPVAMEDADGVMFRFGELFVNLLARPSAAEMIEPALVAPEGSGSRLQLSIFVPDTDIACAELTANGVALLNGPIDRPWGMRTATFADPDGHVWELAQEIETAAAAPDTGE